LTFDAAFRLKVRGIAAVNGRSKTSPRIRLPADRGGGMTCYPLLGKQIEISMTRTKSIVWVDFDGHLDVLSMIEL
jgi:hypothetical protein